MRIIAVESGSGGTVKPSTATLVAGVDFATR